MASLDTNLLLRLVLRDIPEQTDRVTSLLADSGVGGLAVADAVFFEMAWILSGSAYNYDRSMIGAALLYVCQLPQLRCNRVLIEKTVPLYIGHPKISFIDVYLTVYAELSDMLPLLTFDQNLAKAVPNFRLLTQKSRTGSGS